MELDFDTVRLYGRLEEYNALQAAYKRISSNSTEKHISTSEVVLVTGLSGTGKSTLIRKLQQDNQPKCDDDNGDNSHYNSCGRPHFISGKFDQQLKSEPYSALNTAFSDLCDIIYASTNKEEKNEMTTAIRNVIDHNRDGGSKILLNVISSLPKLINGEDNENRESNVPNCTQRSSNKISSGGGGLTDTSKQNKEALNQLKMVFHEFVRCLCTWKHPLVLFLDDLQWADSPSLELISSLAFDSKRKHFLLVGAYRDNEVDENHPLTKHINEIETEIKRKIERIHLTNLDEICVNQLLSDMTRLELEITQPLANMVHHKTLGNIFFVIQFIRNLVEEKLLYYSFSTCRWEFDSEQIQSKTGLSDNVVDLVTSKIKRQPIKVQALLQLAAAISYYINSDLLKRIIAQRKQHYNAEENQPGISAAYLDTKMSLGWKQIMKFEILEQIDDLNSILDMATRERLLDKLGRSRYKFSHDRVQQAAYFLIPNEKDRDSLHLQIGCLMQKAGYFQDISMMFVAADQLNHGLECIVSSERREEYAKFYLQVGKAAIELSAFGPASSYFQAGITLLDNDWENRYDLNLNLYTNLAETESCLGNFESSQSIIEQVLQSATSLDDKLQVYLAFAALLLVQGRLQDCTDTALDILVQLGEPITAAIMARQNILTSGKTQIRRFFKRPVVGHSSNQNIRGMEKDTVHNTRSINGGNHGKSMLTLPLAGEEQVKRCKLKSWAAHKSQCVNANLKRIRELLHKKSNEDLLKLPLMSDKRKIATMKLYFQIYSCSGSRDKIDDASLVTCRMIELTLQYGLCEESIYGFIGYAYLLNKKGKIKEGCAIGNSTSSLIDKLQMKGFAQCNLWTMVNHWTEPIQSIHSQSLDSYRYCLKIGNIDDAFQCIAMYLLAYFFCGLPLKPVLDDMKSFTNQMLEYKQHYIFLSMLPIWQGILNLMGKSDHPLQMEGGYAIEQRKTLPDNSKKNKYKIGNHGAQSVKMQLCYYFGEYEVANELAMILRPVTEGNSTYVVCVRIWFFGLISLALARKKAKEKKFKREAIRIMNMMADWVEQGAINCAHKLLLLRAEDASLQYGCDGTNKEGVKKAYDDAIATALRAGFLQDAALANERAGLFFIEVAPDKNWASYYLCSAHDLYSEWNAKAKADQLVRDYSYLISSEEKQRHKSCFRGVARFDEKLFKLHHDKLSLDRLS